MTENPALTEAAASGRQAALDLDAELRDRETEERAARLAESGPPPGAWEGSSVATAVDIFRMRTELDALQRYRQAVEGSRVWRLAQALRRLVGRAW